MKKFVGIMILIIIAIFGLIKFKDYYYSEVDQELEEKDQLEEKQIDKVAVNNIIRSINNNLANNFMQDHSYQIPEVITDLSLVTVRGEQPESINLEIRDMHVYKGNITYKGVKYHYENGSITIKE